MATATEEKTANSPADIYTPVAWDAYQSDRASRQERQKSRRAEMRKCLDPEYAKQCEDKKPRYEWQVSCTYSVHDDKGRLKTKNEKRIVVAQNENDAWAKFCDELEDARPGRQSCDDCEIKRLKQTN